MHRKTLLSTPRFTVEKRRYTDSHGQDHERDVVVHPGAVVIVPVTADGDIVMIRNYRVAVGEVLLELPAGTRDAKEDVRATAHRELVEETGYEAGHMLPLAEFYASPGICNELMSCFVARDLHFVGQRLEPGEEIEPLTMSPPALKKLIVDGQLRDSKSIAALSVYFARERLA